MKVQQAMAFVENAVDGMNRETLEAAAASLAAEVRRLREENERLREWIMQSGNNNNECVRSVIGKVCDGCMCGAKK